MEVVREAERSTPVVGTWDVVVCGGGPAGIIAAIAAARNGAETLLIERYGFLGGCATAGLVGPISNFKFRGERIIGGVPWEFIAAMAERGGAIIDLPSGNVPFDPEIYKLVSLQMIRDAEAELLLHSYVVGCIRDTNETGKVTHVLVESKSGRHAVGAKVLVDCTGDADLIALAGLPWEIGTEMQPMSLCFRLGGVDTDGLAGLYLEVDDHGGFNAQLRMAMMHAKASGDLPVFGGPWVIHGSTLRRGEVSVNATRFSGNPIDSGSLTKAECTTREDMFRLIEFMRQVLPQLSNCYLIDSGCQVGVRESRRIQGLYQMTRDDITSPKSLPDAVAKGCHPIDIHASDSDGQELRWLHEPYSIPYRALVPKGSHNVLAAGRVISATREAFASIRVQATCMALGQAAGTAAAICSREGIPVGSLDGIALRECLSRQGAIV